MIFEPFKVDFPLHENSETNFARRSAVNFFTEVSRCDTISVELKEALLNGLSEIQISTLNYLINSFKNNIHFDTFESDHYFKAKGLYITLTTHPISTELTKNLFEELLTLIFNSIKISTVITLNETSREIFYASNPPPKTREFVSILLKIVLLSDQILPQIMECIFNTTELKVQGNEIKYGDHFLITYKSVLMEFIGNHVESVLKTMFDDIPNEKFVQNLKFICDLCEFTRKLSTDEGKIVKGNLINMILSLLEKIFEMAKACPDNELHVINMITHLMMIFTEEPMYKLDRDGKIQKWFIEMMAKDEILWDVKTKSLIILPCFTGSQSRVESQSDLMSALVDHLLSVYFPQKCSDFPEGSIKRESLIACFQGILDALVATRSPVILMFLIKASAAEPDHPIEHEIRKGIEKYTTSQESETLKSDLEMLFKVFCERHRYFPIRMTVLKRYFLVMLKASPENVVKSFFNKENYTKIMKLIKNGQGQIHDLVDKIGGFQLLEIFFGISTKEYLESPESPLYDPSKSQKASLEAIFACRDELKKINIYTDLDHSEYFRKSQCAAFNCLCTILANHQTNPMVYNKFLFENQQIWKNLIKSGSDVYQMSSQEIEDYPVVRKRIVAIRDISKVVGIKENRHFHMTTSIYASSLSQDVLKMDFSNTMVRSAAEVAQRENVKSKFGEIALEKIMINDHECMANICAIIHHMYEKKISNFNFTVPWIENLCKMMESHPEINVRRFIAKVIDNCRDIFKLNVARVYRALMKFLVDEGENSPINPFITDLCVLLLEWSENYKLTSDDEKTMASKLIGYLVRNSKSDRRDILKVNLEILKNLIEIWKEFVQIPYETLLETISRTFDKESKENLYGIHLNAVILATGRVTWTTENKNDYFKAIEMSLNNKSAAIYQPAAQLYGMCLKEEFKKKSESDFLEDPRIIELIRRLKEDLNLDRNNAPDILYGIQKYCDYILEPFSNLILSKIPVSIRNIKLKYLEMFLSGMKYYDKSFLYKEIMSTIDLKQLLRNPDFKVISLHIVNRALPLVSPKEVESLYSEVATLIDDSSSEIRDIVYEILMFIYKELAGQIDLNILTATGSFLVEGILDTDVEIQKILIKFWSDPNQLPSALDKRLEKLLCDIYKANSSNFLTAATLLLLYPAITDPNSALPLFQYTPGPDVKHVERFIDTSWRRSMTFTKPPLFVETKALKKTLHTISTQIEGIQMSQNSSQENPEGVPFTPTIDPSLFFNVRDDFSKSIVTQDSFVVPTQVKTLTRRSNLLETQMIANSQSNYGHLRQRFTKQSQNIQRDKAIRAISYRNQRQQESKNAAKERQLSVTLYRRYRDGDFPDLNINALAILLPLQALLKFDKNIARQVLNELFKITSKIGLAREMPIHQSTIANGISRILLKIENSVDMTFVATLFDFAIVNSSVFTMLPETVKNISKASNNITLGILYLEERLNLIDGESDETSLISSVSGNMSVEEHWMQLTDLYRCLSEHDMLNSIFANQIQVDGRLPKAISMMAENRFDLADELWTEILEAINEDKYEYDFSFQSRYDCLASLSDWDALEQNVAPYLAQNEKIWEPGFNQDVILPNLMTAETRLILSEIYDPNTEFLEHLLQWTINPPYWNHLRQHFSEELIMLMVAQTDFNQARLISDQRIRGILLEWSDLNVLSDKLQFNKLEKIRIISELFSTIETFFLASKIDQRTFEKTIKFYNHTLPSIRDSTIFWDTIIMYRTFFWRKLIDLTMDEELAEFEESLFETINKQQVNLFNVALKQENLGLAKNVLKRIEITSKDDTQKSLLRCQLEIKYTKDHGNVIEKLDALQKTVKNSLNIVKELTEASHSNLKINSNLNLAEIGEILLFTPESYHNHATYRQYTRLQTPTAFNVQRKVISYLQNAVDQSEISNDVHNLADCCMKYADFAFTCLEILNLDDKLTLQEDIIKYTLRSMRLGHYRARELFVRILQLPNLHNEQKISDTFKNEVSQVPDWLFLNWIEQILCHIKLDSECCLDVIVENLAKSYPSALLYPLRFILNNLEEGVNLRPFLKGILNSLETPLMNRFIDEMTLVCLPAVKVKNSIEKLIKILNSNEGEFATAISMEVEMWLKNCESHGEDYQKYAKYMKNFENLKKYDMKRAKEKIFTALRHMQIEISKVVQRSRNSLSIERLSPWLANYQLTSGTDSISILGQFVHLKSKPHPDEHAKIVKIDPNLIVLTSLRRPIKIKFHGSDGREYAFLTKYGEDLRQDQRIQQLLSIMSDKMKNNVNCRAQNLQLITYNVTPINSLFGLLNWVGDTISLMLAVRESYKRTENNDYDKFEENVVSKEHKKFITDTHPYHIIAQEATRQEIVEKHQKLVSLIPNGLLKQSLVTYASSLENYYVLKRNFIQSIAAISISHWILGIGDRHLDNTLIDTKTFKLIGIDFGHAFGTATRQLQVPELIPFRMTKQLQSVMEPHGVTGLFERCMTHAMRCFRNEQAVLRACMDLFVREPTIGWLDRSLVTPEIIIDMACSKLQGANSAKITVQELELNRFINKTGYQRILKSANYYGDEVKDLTVEDQVKKLIAQATDEALLGITYYGWRPFL
uniref:non-specific serine/threonine protein kinase n=1 Tax=Culicoides sonorensis TaxID=179676 RepID=A0A336M7V8_CULSO